MTDKPEKELISEPTIVAKQPIEVEVTGGERYSYCPCGLSKEQPFCDGAHKEVTTFRSIKFTPEKSGKIWLCMCKHTKNPPYCDGSHNEL